MGDELSKRMHHVPSIVAIGASAAGLQAFRSLLDALPGPTGFAFIFVQHLDPVHESMLVELLAPHTSLVVLAAKEGMEVRAEHLYVIPPGVSLTLRDGLLHLAAPTERHGMRLPFDVLLHSLAEECGPRAMAVVLSGTGSDGTLGALAIRAKNGLVLVQQPEEAGFDGMPKSAIAAGAASLVLPVAEMPAAWQRYMADDFTARNDVLPRIIELLKASSGHDFALYKTGTLHRRIERRVAAVGAADAQSYTALLETDAKELALLGKDLLIHVTAFFRDPAIFDALARDILPGVIAAHPAEEPLRIWVAGCSTGEETWSLAILFHEAMMASGRALKLQIFASDIDPDAVAVARAALYPAAIAGEVSAERLRRFFVAEEPQWRVHPDLRAQVIFTVQDLLADPPFSRLDFISCRNLLIYLKPEAQTRIFSIFHFALRAGGLLLLGSSETLGQAESGFEPVSKSERLWRRDGNGRPLGTAILAGVTANLRPFTSFGAPRSRQARLAELCRRLVLESHAPAALLIDRDNICLYSMGPTERYLGHAAGPPTHDLFAMARPALRSKLRTVVQEARESGQSTSVEGPLVSQHGEALVLRVDARQVSSEKEDLVLICFVELPGPEVRDPTNDPAGGDLRAAAVERELEATRRELRGAIHSLELSAEEQRTIHEETLSAAEEYQTANEELLTSKEELQSMNEELNALNSQLQDTLENSRTTANDLKNVLYSTDVATIFLDVELRIRFFTPATRAVFSLTPADIGRPLADFRALAPDILLLEDVAAVMQGGSARTHEIETPEGTWFMRRVQPYRSLEGVVQGVVITFSDVTERKEAARALQAATQLAEAANAAKSRFLAAASHDLRQPLQTLTLLQGMLAQVVEGEEAEKLVHLLEPTIGAMSGMLNTLLDINKFGNGMLVPQLVAYPVDALLRQLRDEFGYLVAAQGLELRVVPCGLSVLTDPPLLQQILRNLLGNALKYTQAGSVLLGCRRRGAMLSIEIYDTGIGIAEENLTRIFEEYRQVGNTARERALGLGLGLSIAQRLAELMGHRLSVRSVLGQGSVFSLEAAVAEALPASQAPLPQQMQRSGRILVVEDDPQLRDLLLRMLKMSGHRAVGAADAKQALALIARGAIRPELVVSDYNLPGGINGLRLAVTLRERTHSGLPVIVLTGDTASETLREIANLGCVAVQKPVKTAALSQLIQALLPDPTTAVPRPAPPTAAKPGQRSVLVIDDDAVVCNALRRVLEKAGYAAQDYRSAEAFLAAYQPTAETCLLVDAQLPGMSGFDLLTSLRARGDSVPAIMITGYADIPAAVRAIRAGASDFIDKPIQSEALLTLIALTMEQPRDSRKASASRQAAVERLATLTPRQRAVMDAVLAGKPNKNVAADLGISRRTVETHRAAIMRLTGAKSLPALARLALEAEATEEE